MKFFSLLVVLLFVSGCATSSDSVRAGVVNGQAEPSHDLAAAANTPSAPSRLTEGLDRFTQALGTVFRRNTLGTGPTETGSAAAARPELGRTQPLPPPQASPLPITQSGSIGRNAPERASGPVGGNAGENAAVAYEAAMLRRDARAMARAAARLTRRAVTEDSIRELNSQLGIEADEQLVAAVVHFARR